MAIKRVRLGELLIQNNVITQQQLDAAIDEQQRTGVKIGQALVILGYASEKKILELLSSQLGLPIINLKDSDLDFELAKQLPEAYARRFRALVIEQRDGGLLVGMADPLDINATDEIARLLQQPIEMAIVREVDLLQAIDLVYRRTEDIESFAGQLDEQMGDSSVTELTGLEDDPNVPVVKLLKSLFEDAVQVGATDIHVEPDEKVFRIRLRIDGVLHEQVVKEKAIVPAIILRLKLMSSLNIAEKRIPQDGRFSMKVRDKKIDVRLSIMPTQYGENAVMRLLDQSTGLLDLKKIGMKGEVAERFNALLRKPHGVLLVTGPTGSGKSTTLYGALNKLNTPEKKIITIEDPVEYRLSRINQVQIKEKLGLTFATVLRAILRQDPDIVMVGEMRDTETASIAIRAALTGHLVFSTLHTNDSISSITRLVDMGVDAYLVAAACRGILAQRLLRRVCESCAIDYELTADDKAWFGDKVEGAQFKVGEGCTYCSQTGYKGRVGVFELLELDENMLGALCNNDLEKFVALAKEFLKGRYLFDSALDAAKEGQTTLSEVMRVVGEE